MHWFEFVFMQEVVTHLSRMRTFKLIFHDTFIFVTETQRRELLQQE
jgi:hypothetical protein